MDYLIEDSILFMSLLFQKYHWDNDNPVMIKNSVN